MFHSFIVKWHEWCQLSMYQLLVAQCRPIWGSIKWKASEINFSFNVSLISCKPSLLKARQLQLSQPTSCDSCLSPSRISWDYTSQLIASQCYAMNLTTAWPLFFSSRGFLSVYGKSKNSLKIMGIGTLFILNIFHFVYLCPSIGWDK